MCYGFDKYGTASNMVQLQIWYRTSQSATSDQTWEVGRYKWGKWYSQFQFHLNVVYSVEFHRKCVLQMWDSCKVPLYNFDWSVFWAVKFAWSSTHRQFFLITLKAWCNVPTELKLAIQQSIYRDTPCLLLCTPPGPSRKLEQLQTLAHVRP